MNDDKRRRVAKRVLLDADIEILEPVVAHGVVINASQGGLRVAIDNDLPKDTVCVAEVKTEEGTTVEMVTVAWSTAHPDGYVVGLSFVDEEDEPTTD